MAAACDKIIDAAKATAMGLPPGPQYKDLKAGRDVELPGGRGVVRAADVCSEPVKGRKVAKRRKLI